MQFNNLEWMGNDHQQISRSLQWMAWQNHRNRCTNPELQLNDLHAIEESMQSLPSSINNNAYDALNAAAPISNVKRIIFEEPRKEVKAPQAVDIRYVCMCQANIHVRMNGSNIQVDENDNDRAMDDKAPATYQGNWSTVKSGYQGNEISSYKQSVQGGYQ